MNRKANRQNQETKKNNCKDVANKPDTELVEK